MKSFNIKPEDCDFFVDKEKRTVVCVISHTEFLFIDFIADNFIDNPFTVFTIDKLTMPNKFTGIAKCSEDDEWSERVGRLIAFSRAKDNLNKSFFKRANYYVNKLDEKLDDIAGTLNILGQKLSINSEKRHEQIALLTGEKDGVS